TDSPIHFPFRIGPARRPLEPPKPAPIFHLFAGPAGNPDLEIVWLALLLGAATRPPGHPRCFTENVQMQTVDFSPFYRSTVGFDRLFNRLDTLVGQEAKTYPPYNIERTGEDAYRISIAVAGFSNGDIAIETKENSLVVKGAKPTDTEDKA